MSPVPKEAELGLQPSPYTPIECLAGSDHTRSQGVAVFGGH